MSQKVQIELLSRYSDSESLVIEDQAEQRALWNLLCVLERQLVEPLEGPSTSSCCDERRSGCVTNEPSQRA